MKIFTTVNILLSIVIMGLVMPVVASEEATTWDLELVGAINNTISNSTFESCVGCHGVSYTDSENNEWEGIPLWYLMGMMIRPMIIIHIMPLVFILSNFISSHSKKIKIEALSLCPKYKCRTLCSSFSPIRWNSELSYYIFRVR